MIKLKSLLKEDEIYQFMNMRFDVDAAIKLIEKLKLIPQDINIKAYAEKMLALDRNSPDKKPLSFWHNINHDFLDKIPEDRLEMAGIVATIKTPKTKQNFSLVIDGNHRLAKRYMSNKDTMKVYILDEKNTKKVMF